MQVIEQGLGGLNHGVDGSAGVLDVGKLLILRDGFDEFLVLVNIGNAQHIGAEGTQNLHKLVQIAELVRQEGERDVLPVKLHLRRQ